MKKLIFSVMSVALVAGTMTSCGKSSKGKMSNEWKVTSYSEKSSMTYGNGDVDSDNEVGTATTFTKTSSSTSGGTTTSSISDGTINENTWTIDKDGTWKAVKTTTAVETEADSPIAGATKVTTTKKTVNTNGTWSFVGKNKTDEFKTNERVVFNTTTSSWTSNVEEVVTYSGVTTTTTGVESGTNNYKVGEASVIWTITESKAKSLKLSAETGGSNNHTSTSGGTSITSTSTDSGTSEIVLEQK